MGERHQGLKDMVDCALWGRGGWDEMERQPRLGMVCVGLEGGGLAPPRPWACEGNREVQSPGRAESGEQRRPAPSSPPGRALLLQVGSAREEGTGHRGIEHRTAAGQVGCPLSWRPEVQD